MRCACRSFPTPARCPRLCDVSRGGRPRTSSPDWGSRVCWARGHCCPVAGQERQAAGASDVLLPIRCHSFTVRIWQGRWRTTWIHMELCSQQPMQALGHPSPGSHPCSPNAIAPVKLVSLQPASRMSGWKLQQQWQPVQGRCHSLQPICLLRHIRWNKNGGCKMPSGLWSQRKTGATLGEP